MLLPTLTAAIYAALDKPHIVFVLADDYGWNDVGYHQNAVSSGNPSGENTTNGFIATPAIDAICKQGVKLENYYVQPLCSPTRGTIMTGRYPSHTGVGPEVIRPSFPYGMPSDETFLPELLREAGYDTHMIGKWHLGLCDERYTPTFRGFNSFLGYLLGAEDYFAHTREYNGANGLDFRNGSAPNVFPTALKTASGQYSTEIFSRAAVDLIANHDTDIPLFLYLPFQAVHEPHQAPEEYIEPYNTTIPHNTSNGKSRLIKAGMVSAMDSAVHNVTEALKDAGMWESTVFIFSTDNGGPVPVSSNYPLRGGKSTNWEGGVRGVAFIKGTDNDLAPLPSGVTSMELMHTTDWLPTLVRGVAKGNTTQCKPLDGFNQWNTLRSNVTTERTTIVHNMPAAGEGFSGGAIRVGKHKMLVNGMQTEGGAKQSPPPEMAPHAGDVVPEAVSYGGVDIWVFDVLSDPTESHNLANDTALVASLKVVYDTYQTSAVADLNNSNEEDPTADPELREDKTWGPFVNSTKCKF